MTPERVAACRALRVQNQQVHYGTALPICNCVPISFFPLQPSRVFRSRYTIIIIHGGENEKTNTGECLFISYMKRKCGLLRTSASFDILCCYCITIYASRQYIISVTGGNGWLSNDGENVFNDIIFRVYDERSKI